MILASRLIACLFLTTQLADQSPVQDLSREEADRLVSSLKKEVSDNVENRLGEHFRTSMPVLIDGLTSDIVGVRLGCIRILGQIGSPACVDALLTALKDPDPGVRVAAVRYLCGSIKHEAAAPGVVELFADPDEWVRYQAARYAGRLKATRQLLESALRSDNERMRAGAIVAMTRNSIGEWDDGTVHAWRISSLRDSSPVVRAAVCETLYFDVSRATLPDLLNAAGDEDARVRAASMEAFRGASYGDIRDEALAAIASALRDDEPVVRKAALEAIDDFLRFGDGLEPAVVESIADSMRSEWPGELIVEALYTAGDVRATELTDTCRALVASDDVRISLAAACAYYQLEQDQDSRGKTLEVLADILFNYPDEAVRSHAAFRIGFLRSPESHELLCRSMLSDRSPDVRETCGNMLSGRRSTPVTEALLRAVADYEGAFHTAAWSLVNDREDRAFDLILKATRQKEGRHRSWAAKCLETLDFRRAVPRLIELMSDPSVAVRFAVASTFKYDHDTRALPELERLAKHDWSRSVREVATEAVAAIRQQIAKVRSLEASSSN
ncbi:MAG: HEAT repeat domain-containing protein [Armatimonadetes bacterium]|nr:HEAT repeat domain-containing protein [Armatimonadota bacterium]